MRGRAQIQLPSNVRILDMLFEDRRTSGPDGMTACIHGKLWEEGAILDTEGGKACHECIEIVHGPQDVVR